ncbi:uncharacterized protein G2W53_027384 [Senna tora]|uniref:Uncharacterized protein n=1 Tax=Senna tora TaxID=362788 RepID=A0A834WM69_9FABA|nr:uncharacterized protein G2W53_027384 [Senna tora]
MEKMPHGKCAHVAPHLDAWPYCPKVISEWAILTVG